MRLGPGATSELTARHAVSRSFLFRLCLGTIEWALLAQRIWMSIVNMRIRRKSERWLEQGQTWAGRSCLNDRGRQRKVDMKEILTRGTFVKVRPSIHLLE